VPKAAAYAGQLSFRDNPDVRSHATGIGIGFLAGEAFAPYQKLYRLATRARIEFDSFHGTNCAISKLFFTHHNNVLSRMALS
jgi:hypothetical protein